MKTVERIAAAKWFWFLVATTFLSYKLYRRFTTP